MQRRNELLGGCHGQMELLFIIPWTRQKQREFNHLLYNEKSDEKKSWNNAQSLI